MSLLPRLHTPRHGPEARTQNSLVLARLPDLLDEHDPLTGLLNRSSFTPRVEIEMDRAVRTGQPLTLVCFRLDLFGEVTRSLGHLAGVRLFRDVSRRLLSSVRGSDVVGRLADDEFAILLPGSDFEAGLAVALRAKERLERPYEPDMSVCISVVFGMASYPDGAAAYAHDLIAHACAVVPPRRTAIGVARA